MRRGFHAETPVGRGRWIDASRNRGTKGQRGRRNYRARSLAHAPNPCRIRPSATCHRALGRNPLRAGFDRRGPRGPRRDPRPAHPLRPPRQLRRRVRGRGERGPDQDPRRPRHLPRDHLPLDGRSASTRLLEAALQGVAQPAPPEHPRRLPVQHPPPLRPRQRLLPALARRGDGVHLRVLPARERHPRGGPAGEDGPCLPQARASSRAAGRGGGLRLGLARDPHGPRVRRERAGVQHLARADSLRARTGGRAGTRRPGRVRGGRLPHRQGRV